MKKVPVECRNVRLAYGATQVLDDVNLDIGPGEFFALLGPSGSGKSTLLRVIAGFNPRHQGRVLIDGVDLAGKAPWERNVGMVFQNYALWPHLTVWDNVAFGLVERKFDKITIREKAGAALEMVGLSEYAERRPSQLSGGQQQRVALARTLAVEPQVLLLDEPLSNLDRGLRVQMRQELFALQRRLGITTIFVTHDQEEAMTTADRMAVLDKGVVQQVGTPSALYDDPVNTFVAGFVGTMNQMKGVVRARDSQTLTLLVEGVGDLSFSVGVRAPEAASLIVCFRPHALRVEIANATRDDRHVWISGTLEASEFVGEFTRYHVRVGGHRLAADQPHYSGQAKIPIGGTVSLGLEPAQLRFFPA